MPVEMGMWRHRRRRAEAAGGVGVAVGGDIGGLLGARFIAARCPAALEDEGRRYLTRSWLASPDDSTAGGSVSGKPGKRAEWNGRDWFVSFGEHENGRSWADGRRYCFVSAGGNTWYSRTLKNLPAGARVNVHLPGLGYVAVGVTLAEATRFDQAQVQVDDQWVSLAAQQLAGTYRRDASGDADADDVAEYVVAVRWLQSRPSAEAYWEKGMFANQNSACKLRQEFTLNRLNQHFHLDEEPDS